MSVLEYIWYPIYIRNMKTLILPDGTEEIPVRITGGAIEAYDGTLVIKRWTPQETRKRAFKRTFRIVGTVCAFSLVGLIIHILLLLIIPLLAFTIFGSVILFSQMCGETTSFFCANSICPGCRLPQRLEPYLGTGLQEKVSLICPGCGQTAQAVSKERHLL